MKKPILICLVASLVTQVGAAAVAVISSAHALDYWSNFLEGGGGFPWFMKAFLPLAPRLLPAVSFLLVLVTVVAALRVPADWAKLSLVVLNLLAAAIVLGSTLVAIDLPFAEASRMVRDGHIIRHSANQASQAIGAPGAPQPER